MGELALDRRAHACYQEETMNLGSRRFYRFTCAPSWSGVEPSGMR
jgi:hypothetical protein